MMYGFYLPVSPFFPECVSECVRIIYNHEAPSPPTPSICSSPAALHQLSLSLFASSSLFFLPPPLFSCLRLSKTPSLYSSSSSSLSFSLTSSQSWVCERAQWNLWHLQCDLIKNLPGADKWTRSEGSQWCSALLSRCKLASRSSSSSIQPVLPASCMHVTNYVSKPSVGRISWMHKLIAIKCNTKIKSQVTV